MIIWIITLVILLTLYNTTQETNQVTIGNYQTKNFSKESKKLFEKFQKLYSKQTLQEYAMMEDLFIQYEKQSVCSGVSRLREAVTLDQQMKDKFQGWNFYHHQKILKQISEPSKLIDQSLQC